MSSSTELAKKWPIFILNFKKIAKILIINKKIGNTPKQNLEEILELLVKDLLFQDDKLLDSGQDKPDINSTDDWEKLESYFRLKGIKYKKYDEDTDKLTPYQTKRIYDYLIKEMNYFDEIVKEIHVLISREYTVGKKEIDDAGNSCQTIKDSIEKLIKLRPWMKKTLKILNEFLSILRGGN